MTAGAADRDLITAAGTVECTECGHEIEDLHSRKGCEWCSCTAAWTYADKIAYRRRLGLPGRWRR